jgi:hypothetical protein
MGRTEMIAPGELPPTPSNAGSMIRFESVTKQYFGGTVAVRELSLEALSGRAGLVRVVHHRQQLG